MRVIIPAAGVGSRLMPLTSKTSKAIVPICGRPLLSYNLEWLSDLGVSELILVTGHHSSILRDTLLSLPKRPKLTFVQNDSYESTNSIVSLHLSISYWSDPFCVIDSDVIASPSLLQKLLVPGPSALVVDTAKSFETADMKVELRNGFIWHMDKPLERAKHQGEFFGLSRWSGIGMQMLEAALDQYIRVGQTQIWYEFPIRDVAKKTNLEVISTTSDQWAEVDRPEDIQTATELITRLEGGRA